MRPSTPARRTPALAPALAPLVAAALAACASNPGTEGPGVVHVGGGGATRTVVARGEDLRAVLDSWSPAGISWLSDSEATGVQNPPSAHSGPPAWLVSRVLEAPPFDTLLPSWNVEGPASRTSFRFEARVGRRDDDTWSPWLDFGGWSPDGESLPDPGPEQTVEFEEGHVAVDVLEARDGVRWDRLQWRLTVFSEPGLNVHSVAWCTADREALTRAPRTGWPTEDVRVDLPVRSQKLAPPELAPRICSPTSVAMVLAHHGAEHPTEAVAEALFDAEHDLYGNWNRAVQGAFLLGARGHLERIADWGRVVELLRDDVPVIASIAAEAGQLDGAPYPRTAGHLLVIRGLTADGRVLVHDPAAPDLETVPRAYDRRQFEAVWFGHGGVAYVLDGPAER